MKHEFHPEAEQELLEEAERYESEVPGLGLRFGDEVHRVIELLLENPEAGSPLDWQPQNSAPIPQIVALGETLDQGYPQCLKVKLWIRRL